MLDQLQIQGIHYHISDQTLEFIKEKLSKIDFLKDLITNGTIRVIRDTVHHEHYIVEADIHLHQKQHFHFETKHDQLYPAIENVIHKLRHKLSEEHKKLKSHKDSHTPSLHHADGHPEIASPEE